MLKKIRLNGADVLAKALVDSGIQVVFGIPGVHNLVLFEAMRRSGIRIVPTTHEQGAGFMANGYGRVTGKPGVFVTVPGPGLTNALTPITEALVDSTPMLAIVTNVPQSGKKFQMHEIKQTLLAQPVVKSVRDVERAADIPSALKAALQETTSGEPGPCVLQIPSNLFWERVDPSKKMEIKKQPETPVPTTQIETIASRIKDAQQVGLLVGLGTADATREVQALAEWVNAPVASTGSGRGVMNETHPLSLGFGWMAESVDSVNRVLESCDLLLAIGIKFSQTGAYDYRLKIECPLIHVDASPAVLGQNYETEISLVMDAGTFLLELLKHKNLFGPRHDDDLLAMIRTEKQACEKRVRQDRSITFQIGETEFTSSEFYGSLRRSLPADAILVTDAGFNERLTLHNWIVHEPRTLINPNDFESMGFAIPTAIGAAFALPGRRVVVIVGDGGLVMTGLELMSAVREKINNLTVIVLNNKGFGIIKKIQEDMFGVSTAVDVGAPDFRALAQSIHINFQSGSGMAALEQALWNDRPTLLEVKMRYNGRDEKTNRRKQLKNDVKQVLQKITGLR